jgi:hypothetical protein
MIDGKGKTGDMYSYCVVCRWGGGATAAGGTSSLISSTAAPRAAHRISGTPQLPPSAKCSALVFSYSLRFNSIKAAGNGAPPPRGRAFFWNGGRKI